MNTHTHGHKLSTFCIISCIIKDYVHFAILEDFLYLLLLLHTGKIWIETQKSMTAVTELIELAHNMTTNSGEPNNRTATPSSRKELSGK
jgi:hypothetical protein